MGKASWIRGLAVAACCMVLFVLPSCGGGDGGGTPQAQQPAIASIEVTSQNGSCLDPQDTRPYTAVARDASGNVIDGVTFTWSSSVTAVATVDSGVATGVATGSTHITASAGGVQSAPVALEICAATSPGGPGPGEPPPGSVVLSGDVDGATERETALDTQASTNYRFEFDDPFTRSVMFHNTFYANAKNGEAVTVRAYYKVEGQTAWVEEDWTGYEWIGFCRDFKQQRLSDLVIVTSGSGVVASQPARLMRNVVGCWAFTGTTRRLTAEASWSDNSFIELAASPIFDLNPGGHPNQYTDAASGRLRVPVASPLFRTVEWRLREGYVDDSGCTHLLDQTQTETTVGQGGTGFATLFINNFIDSLPATMRQDLITLNGTKSLAYTADGGSSVTGLVGSVSGPEDCGTTYESAPALWLLNRDDATPAPVIDRLDGTLTGFFAEDTGSGLSTFTWTLTPQREP